MKTRKNKLKILKIQSSHIFINQFAFVIVYVYICVCSFNLNQLIFFEHNLLLKAYTYIHKYMYISHNT